MSSRRKKNVARAGTMQATSKEGMSYLAKNLPAHWRHINQLKVRFAEDQTETTKTVDRKRPATDGKNPKNGQSPTKKQKLTKTRTMAATTQEGALLMGAEVLGDTRQMTKKKAKAATAANRDASAEAAVAKKRKKKAKAAVGKNLQMKKSSKARGPSNSKKPTTKRAGTMLKTAKEGKAFLGKNGSKLSSRRTTKQRNV